MWNITFEKRLNDLEFNHIVKNLTLSRDEDLDNKYRAAAYAILVNGKKRDEVANDYGLDEAALYRTVLKIWKQFTKNLAIPKGWQTILVTMPPEDARRWKAREAELLRQIKK